MLSIVRKAEVMEHTRLASAKGTIQVCMNEYTSVPRVSLVLTTKKTAAQISTDTGTDTDTHTDTNTGAGTGAGTGTGTIVQAILMTLKFVVIARICPTLQVHPPT
jgi:hypothetical protein